MLAWLNAALAWLAAYCTSAEDPAAFAAAKAALAWSNAAVILVFCERFTPLILFAEMKAAFAVL